MPKKKAASPEPPLAAAAAAATRPADCPCAANAAGVNDYGKMVEVDIEDSCDYTFPTAGV